MRSEDVDRFCGRSKTSHRVTKQSAPKSGAIDVETGIVSPGRSKNTMRCKAASLTACTTGSVTFARALAPGTVNARAEIKLSGRRRVATTGIKTQPRTTPAGEKL